MRRLFSAVLFLLSCISPSIASTIAVDALVGGTQTPGIPGLSPAGYQTPLYTFASGDVIDLGILQYASYFIVIPHPGILQAIIGSFRSGFGPVAPAIPSSGPFCDTSSIPGNPFPCPPGFGHTDFQTIALQFTLPPGATQLQLAWTGPYNYTPPSAVPLPAALPLFASGLAGLGWISRRRRKQLPA